MTLGKRELRQAVAAFTASTGKAQTFYCIAPSPIGELLLVADHASNLVPDDIDLGIDPALMNEHIAVDIGVREVGELMAQKAGIAAFQATVSRLVCDVNREPHAPAVMNT